MKTYQYDIAISLCKQDVEFARKLVNVLNPGLKVFFYENNQEELISKSGPEVFAKIFKEQSRIIVILSRKEWSESFYTDIERNAIIDRTSVKNEGYGAIMVIPMMQGESPEWYPSTRIYASPQKFSIEELAHFVEFKVTEYDGVIKPITVEDRYQNLLARIEQKKELVHLQQSKEAIQQANNEVDILKDFFNQKISFLLKDIFYSTTQNLFPVNGNEGYFGIGDYAMLCKILMPDSLYQPIVTTQDFHISFEIMKSYNNRTGEVMENEERIFYYSPNLKGWSKPYLFEQASDKELLVLFSDRSKREYYDLSKPLDTMALVDDWFQKLLKISSANIERYI